MVSSTSGCDRAQVEDRVWSEIDTAELLDHLLRVS